MTVYVDNARIHALVGRNRVSARWSHLTADSQEELHAFAERIGLRRVWFQTCKSPCSRPGVPCPHWHYDVTDQKRDQAIQAGAVPVDIREMGQIIRQRRNTPPEVTP